MGTSRESRGDLASVVVDLLTAAMARTAVTALVEYLTTRWKAGRSRTVQLPPSGGTEGSPPSTPAADRPTGEGE